MCWCFGRVQRSRRVVFLLSVQDVSALSSWLLEELRLNCNKAPGGASGEPPVLTEALLLGLLRLHTKAAQMSNDADHKLFVMNQAVLFINEHTAGAGHGEKIPLSGAVVAEFVRLCCANGLLDDAVEHCRELDELFPQLRQPVVAQVNWEGGGDDGGSTGGWKVPPKARVEGGGLSKRMRRQAKALGHELPPLPELPRTSRDRQKDGIGSPSASASAVLSTAEPYEPIFFAKCLRVKQFAERAMSAPAGRSGRAIVDAGTSAAVRELDDMLVLYNELLNKGLTVTPRVVESLVTSCVYEEIAQNVGNNVSISVRVCVRRVVLPYLLTLCLCCFVLYCDPELQQQGEQWRQQQRRRCHFGVLLPAQQQRQGGGRRRWGQHAASHRVVLRSSGLLSAKAGRV